MRSRLVGCFRFLAVAYPMLIVGCPQFEQDFVINSSANGDGSADSTMQGISSGGPESGTGSGSSGWSGSGSSGPGSGSGGSSGSSGGSSSSSGGSSSGSDGGSDSAGKGPDGCALFLHDNGLGRMFTDCYAGISYESALDACAAFAGDRNQCVGNMMCQTDAGVTLAMCSSASPTDCACWSYSGQDIGYVYDAHSAGMSACKCPGPTFGPSWH